MSMAATRVAVVTAAFMAILGLFARPAVEAVAQEAPPLLASGADWQPPPYSQVRDQVLQWLAERDLDEQQRREAEQLWGGPAVDSSVLLERVAETLAMGDARVAELYAVCMQPTGPVPPPMPTPTWLDDPETAPIVVGNMRLLLGRWLVQQKMYDEAREQLESLEPKDVVAPATLLFHQGVVYYHLLQKDKGVAAADRLLEGAQRSPSRYVAVARLMRDDLQAVKPDTLDHISRRMRDVQRRLDLGRANRRVREIEDGVVESLDKLIKKLEEQQKQQQQSAAGQSQSSRPAQDSRIMGGRGPGEVTKKPLGEGGDWGSLPPKQREEALQQIGRDFPSHYRDVIEEYFRRKAAEGSN